MLSNLLVAPLQILYNLPAILLGLTFHEFMHAYVAVAAGDDTPRIQGRLTLNPLKHLDPIGTLSILLIGFGWAKPVQVNMNNLRNGRKSYLYVSLAGVLGNFTLAFISAAIIYFSPNLYSNSAAVYQILYSMFYINIMLIAFNLLPIPPLDGFNVLTTVVRFRNIQTIYNIKKYGFLVLIALMIFGIISVYISFMTSIAWMGFSTLFGLINNLAGLF